MVHYEGLLGQPINEQKARERFLIAAQFEHIDALFNCGYFYEYGIGGEQQLQKALKYYDVAANFGDDEAKIRAAHVRQELDL